MGSTHLVSSVIEGVKSKLSRDGLPERMVIASASFAPSTYPCSLPDLEPRVQCPSPGFDAEMLNLLMRFANITPELIQFPPPVFWGNKGPSGEWTGLLGMVHNRTVDTISTNFLQIPVRLKDFDYSYPINQDEPVFIVRAPELSLFAHSMLAFRVFSPPLWTAIGGVILVILLALLITRKLTRTEAWMSSTKLTWNSFRMMIDQSSADMRHSFFGANMLLTWLGLICMFTIGLYQGCLSTSLLHPPTIPPFKSADHIIDLIAQKRLRVISESLGYWYIQEMRTSESYWYRRMREAVADNPVVEERDRERALDLVETGAFIMPTGDHGAQRMIEGRCSLVVVRAEDQPRKWRGFIFAKGNPWLPFINEAVLQTASRGRIIREAYGGEEDRSAVCAQRHAVEQLGIRSLAGVFATLVVGALAAALALLVERVKHALNWSISRGNIARQLQPEQWVIPVQNSFNNSTPVVIVTPTWKEQSVKRSRPGSRKHAPLTHTRSMASWPEHYTTFAPPQYPEY